MQRVIWSVVGLVVIAAAAIGTVGGLEKRSDRAEGSSRIISFPQFLSKTCRNGRAKLYDECGDQMDILRSAARKAAVDGKVMLVSYGAEWCIWCHVFDAYIHGGIKQFSYTFASPSAIETRRNAVLYERAAIDVSGEATKLQQYVADHFVIAHIDAQYAPNGRTVLTSTGAAKHDNGWLPFIFTVKVDGQFAAQLDHGLVESRRDTADWYRGYHRVNLLKVLTGMHDAAHGEPAKN